MKVQVNLFSGKSIGEYTAVKNAEGNYEVSWKNGQLGIFDCKTLKQLNAPKEQFACKLVLLEKKATKKATKKAAKIPMIEFTADWTGEIVVLNASDLTEMETAVMIAGRNNEYEDALNGGTWTFTVEDNAKGVKPEQFRGVCSSLIQKGYVSVFVEGRDSYFCYTKEGKKLFSDYIG